MKTFIIVALLAVVCAEVPTPTPLYHFTGVVQATYANAPASRKNHNITILLDTQKQCANWRETTNPRPSQYRDLTVFLDHFIYDEHESIYHSMSDNTFTCTRGDVTPRFNPFVADGFKSAKYTGLGTFNGRIVNKWEKVDARLNNFSGEAPTLNETVWQDAFTGQTVAIEFFDAAWGAYQLVFNSYSAQPIDYLSFAVPEGITCK
jgi:hypothetical protein